MTSSFPCLKSSGSSSLPTEQSWTTLWSSGLYPSNLKFHHLGHSATNCHLRPPVPTQTCTHPNPHPTSPHAHSPFSIPTFQPVWPSSNLLNLPQFLMPPSFAWDHPTVSGIPSLHLCNPYSVGKFLLSLKTQVTVHLWESSSVPRPV